MFRLRVTKEGHVTCRLRNRKWSMDFDDSFFEDDDDFKKKEDRRKKSNEKINYYPKICEPEVFRYTNI